MRAFEKIIKLADRFEYKLKYAEEPKVEQKGTTELFFDSEDKQTDFAKVIMDREKSVYKILANYFSKNELACSFDLKANAEPGQSANWILEVNPTALKSNIAQALNNEFQKIMNISMPIKQKAADAVAKQGAGSGTISVGAIELK